MSEQPNWITSSASSGNGNCVQVAFDGDKVLIRDSKDPNGPVLKFTPAEWDAFDVGMHRYEFARPQV